MEQYTSAKADQKGHKPLYKRTGKPERKPVPKKGGENIKILKPIIVIGLLFAGLKVAEIITNIVM